MALNRHCGPVPLKVARVICWRTVPSRLASTTLGTCRGSDDGLVAPGQGLWASAAFDSKLIRVTAEPSAEIWAWVTAGPAVTEWNTVSSRAESHVNVAVVS